MDDLVAKMNGFVTKMSLSNYERGQMQPGASVITELAKALGVRPEELWTEPQVEVSFTRFRKKALLGQKEQSRLRNLLMLELERRARVQDLVAPNAHPQVPGPFEVHNMDDAEKAAMQVRQEWNLGEAPIHNLTDLLECHLVHVVNVDAPSTFDGISANILDAADQSVRATAVVSRTGVCRERQRINLAHELGHIVEQPRGDVDEEKAAFRFASALLAPASALRGMTGNERSSIALEELMMLREHFGMSMQAVLFRMRELGIISERCAQEWWKTFAKNGWRKKEPGETVPERSRWLRRCVMRAFSEGLLSFDDAADLLGSEEGLPMPESVAQRRAFLSLPAEEQARLLKQEAERSAAHHQQNLRQGEERGHVGDNESNQ